MTNLTDSIQIISSRNLTQDEIDAYNRHAFITPILAEIEHRGTVRFIAPRNHTNLCTFKMNTPGQYEFSIAKNHWYTYKLSDVIEALEKLYNESNIVSLHGEFQVRAEHQTANAD